MTRHFYIHAYISVLVKIVGSTGKNNQTNGHLLWISISTTFLFFSSIPSDILILNLPSSTVAVASGCPIHDKFPPLTWQVMVSLLHNSLHYSVHVFYWVLIRRFARPVIKKTTWQSLSHCFTSRTVWQGAPSFIKNSALHYSIELDRWSQRSSK